MIHRTKGRPGQPAPKDDDVAREVRENAIADELVRLAALQLEDDDVAGVAFDERRLVWQAEEERRRSEASDMRQSHHEAVARIAGRVQAAARSARLAVVRRSGQPTFHVPDRRCLIIDAIGQPDIAVGEGSDRLAPRIDLGVAAGVGRDLWDEPCDSWIELPVDMPAGRYIGLGVNGDSMEPLMHTGDTILVRVGSEVQPNAVIVARHPDNGYVVKRVDRLTPTTIQLASLNAGYPSLAIPRDPSLIVGTVVLRWCAHEEQTA